MNSTDAGINSNSDRSPLYLLADSQLLFWNISNSRFIASLTESLQTVRVTIARAAYIGVSNSDNLEFYNLFTAAMDYIFAHESKMIKSKATG